MDAAAREIAALEMSSLADFLNVSRLVCPDDRNLLVLVANTLRCARCGSSFPVFGHRIIDILPKARAELPGELASGYRDEYLSSAANPFRLDMEPWAWGTKS